MAELTAKIVVENNTQRPRIVWVEPWGEDYTLLPREQLEIVSRDDSQQPFVHVVERQDSTAVHVDVGGCTEIIQNGTRLECGHNRKAALDAGLKL